MAQGQFDAQALYAALDAARQSHKMTWKKVAGAAGISASTLTRMAQGKRPDVDSLAALLDWSGLSADDFVRRTSGQMPAVAARKAASPVVDIAAPRGDLADIVEGGHRDERLRDIVLRSEVRDLLLRVISENRSPGRLERFGVSPRRRLLFHGAPGCGKTLAAAVLAGEMGLPLRTVRLGALYSRFLGSTAVQLRVIFAEMPRRPGVYLFDEFDSVANRVVTAFLQLVDADASGSVLVLATNHRAMSRRFDVIVPFEKPTCELLVDLLELRLSTLGLTAQHAEKLAAHAEGCSFADVARACDDAVRTMALDDRHEIFECDVAQALDELWGPRNSGS